MSERPHPTDRNFSNPPDQNGHECPGLDEQLHYVGNNDTSTPHRRKAPTSYTPAPLSAWKRAPLHDQFTTLYGVQADKKPPTASTSSQSPPEKH